MVTTNTQAELLALAERLEILFDKVKLWPETRMKPEAVLELGEGFSDLLALRNAVPDAIKALRALAATDGAEAVAPSKKLVWGLTLRTVGGQLVGREPLKHEVNPRHPASETCMHCGGDCGPGSCPALEELRLREIPDEEIAAFGCSMEAAAIDVAIDFPEILDDPDLRCQKWCHRSSCSYALRPAAPPAPEVKVEARVKPLDWVKHPTAALWRADTIIGRYQAFNIVHPSCWTFDSSDGLTTTSGDAETEAEAKAAAQADYEQRIRSALVEASAAPPQEMSAEVLKAMHAALVAMSIAAAIPQVDAECDFSDAIAKIKAVLPLTKEPS